MEHKKKDFITIDISRPTGPRVIAGPPRRQGYLERYVPRFDLSPVKQCILAVVSILRRPRVAAVGGSLAIAMIAHLALAGITNGFQPLFQSSLLLTGAGVNPAPSGGGGGCTQATNFLARVSSASLTIDGTHTTAYTNLICGLVTDGIITGSMSGSGSGASACGVGSFDGLYIFATDTTAGSNQTLTTLNLCGTSFTITINGGFIAGFVADRGWTSINTSTDFLDTGFNPSTATSPNFTLNSAHQAVWNNTNATDNNAIIGTGNATVFDHSYVKFSDNNHYSRLNDSSAAAGYVIANPQSLLFDNRTAAGAIQSFQGSTSLGTGTQASGGSVNNATMQILRNNGAGLSGSQQIGAASFGGSFSSGQVANYYARMKTYMTAVGVCGVITCP